MAELAGIKVTMTEGFKKIYEYIKTQKSAEELALNLPIADDTALETFNELIGSPRFYGAYVRKIATR